MTTVTEPVFEDVAAPQQPAANPDQAALLAWAAANPTDRPPVDRAANGRYKLPHPDTGKPATWTRATNYAGTIDDDAGLTVWRHRLLTAGILANVDQFEGTALDDKTALTAVAGKALHLAGEKLAADVGTSLHTAVEHWAMGTDLRPPEPYAADIDAYAGCMFAHDIHVQPYHVERIVVCADLGIAGTVDGIATHNGRHHILDLKTGSSYDRLSYAVQLAIYAHSPHMWKLDGTGYEPTPDVDQDIAYIVHMPAGTGTATLVEVDIAAGWELVQLCGQVRDARKRKGMFKALVPDTLEAELEASLLAVDRTQWLVDRKDALKANNPEMVPAAIEAWRATGIAFQPPWTDTEIDTLSTVLHGVEQQWPATDPAAPPPPPLTIGQEETPPALPAVEADDDAHRLADTDDVTGLKATIKGLAESDHKIAMLTHWAKQGRNGERPWDSTDGMTVRQWTIARAVVRFLVAVGADDQRLRMALAYILGDDLQTTWPTGAVLGTLTTAQANELAEISDAYRAKDTTVRAVIDAT